MGRSGEVWRLPQRDAQIHLEVGAASGESRVALRSEPQEDVPGHLRSETLG